MQNKNKTLHTDLYGDKFLPIKNFVCFYFLESYRNEFKGCGVEWERKRKKEGRREEEREREKKKREREREKRNFVVLLFCLILMQTFSSQSLV